MDLPTFETMIAKVSQAYPAIANLVASVGFFVGLAFVIASIMKLRHLGEQRNMMQHNEVAGPILGLLLGAILMHIPTFLKATAVTIWGENALLDYPTSNINWNSATITPTMIALLNTIRLVGIISFIRGWMILKKATEQGGHGQGFLGKGLAHIIGGIFCWHIGALTNAVASTFGISQVFQINS